MTALFFSYSHADERLRDELEKQLAILKRQGLIETWHDRRIDAGQDFAEEISDHLESSQIVLLLVSPDFIASNYCYDIELKSALAKHERGEAKVIPVILRDCLWQRAPFGHLLGVPTDGRPVTQWQDSDRAFREVAEAVERAALGFKSSPFRRVVEKKPKAHCPRNRKRGTKLPQKLKLESLGV